MASVAYCTQQDVFLKYGTTKIQNLTIHKNDEQAISNSARLDRFIDEASNTIDDYLDKETDIWPPASTAATPGPIRDICVKLVYALCHEFAGNRLTTLEDTMKEKLQAYANGKKIGGNAVGATAQVDVNTDDGRVKEFSQRHYDENGNRIEPAVYRNDLDLIDL